MLTAYITKKAARKTSAHRKSIVKEAIDRLDGKMAIGQSRGKAKEAANAAGESAWAFSTGLIHSFKTRTVYQQHVVRFIRWTRSAYSIKSLAELDPRADALATEWLQRERADDKSPYTLQAERAALRLFFDDRQLAARLAIPRRARESIRRSRGPAGHDRHFQPDNWPTLLNFIRASGLRRNELRLLRVGDILESDPEYFGQATVKVLNGKGGKPRTVPVLPGYVGDVLAVKAGRGDEVRAFERIPKHLDVHHYRREYAKALYLHYALGWSLPPATGRLKRNDYDRAAAQRVSWALGHNRIDVVLRHYIR